MHEAELEKLAGTRLQLEVQVNTLESANINANTLEVMRKGANALKDIHNGMYVTHTKQPPLSFSFFGFLKCAHTHTLFIFFWVC